AVRILGYRRDAGRDGAGRVVQHQQVVASLVKESVAGVEFQIWGVIFIGQDLVLRGHQRPAYFTPTVLAARRDALAPAVEIWRVRGPVETIRTGAQRQHPAGVGEQFRNALLRIVLDALAVVHELADGRAPQGAPTVAVV